MNASLTWTPFSPNTGGTQTVELRVLGTTPWTIHSTEGPSVSTKNITGLDSNKVYEFRVVSHCAFGNPVSSALKEKIEFTCPVVTIVDTTPTTVQYSFSHLGGSIDRYDVDIINPSNSVVSSNVHTTMSGTITGNFTGLSANTAYTIRVKPRATGNISTYYKNDCTVWSSPTIPFSTHWEINTYICEQDAVFTQQAEYTPFSSPAVIYYNSTNSMCYVGDHDNGAGNVYKFNPVGFTGTVTPVAGMAQEAYVVKSDEQYKRLYFVGQNTSGLIVFDIDTETFATYLYGTNGVLFNRVNINIVGDRIFLQDRGDNTITILDRATLGTVGSMNISAIPSGTTYFDDYNLTAVGNEVWVSANYNGTPNIARYNMDLDTLIGTIVFPGAAIEGGKYRGSAYYDEVNDKFYVSDGGSRKLLVIDGSTATIEHTKTFTNTQGKTYMIAGFVTDPITGKLFMNLQGYNSPSDSAKTNRVYDVDRTSYDMTMLYTAQSFGNLTQQGITNILWGTSSGLPAWEGGAWATDGKIIKYTR